MRFPALFFIAVMTVLGTPSARADLIETASLSLISSPTGPVQQTISLPQFNPALGTLNSVTLTVSPTVQFVFEVFDTGAGALSVTALDTLSFGGTPVSAETVFSINIPANQPIFTFMPPAISAGTLTESFGPNLASFFTGTGTVPFDLSLAPPNVVQFSGATASSVLVFAGVSGTVTADFAFTPTPTPEPAGFALAGLGLIAMGTFALRQRTQSVIPIMGCARRLSWHRS